MNTPLNPFTHQVAKALVKELPDIFGPASWIDYQDKSVLSIHMNTFGLDLTVYHQKITYTMIDKIANHSTFGLLNFGVLAVNCEQPTMLDLQTQKRLIERVFTQLSNEPFYQRMHAFEPANPNSSNDLNCQPNVSLNKPTKFI